MSPSGKISEAMVEAWKDAYAAFHGAFDTPLARRRQNDEYASDARNRLREFDQLLTAALSVSTPGTGGTDKWLGELLAIIHRDGGQYQAQHGVEKAVEDAHSILAAAFSTPQAGDLGAVKVIDAWAHFHDGELLSVTLRKETADAYRKNGLDVRQLAALSSTPVGEMDGWQPIETAPKPQNGEIVRILAAFSNGRVDTVYWSTNSKGEGYWHSTIMAMTNGIRFMRKNQPTHWQPLPASPQGVR